jgi:hypothetical protein
MTKGDFRHRGQSLSYEPFYAILGPHNGILDEQRTAAWNFHVETFPIGSVIQNLRQGFEQWTGPV